MNVRNVLRVCLAAVLLAAATASLAQSTFRITQVFSNLDGSIQFVMLTEMAGRSDQQHVRGLTLTVTHGGVAKAFTFPEDLAVADTANSSIVVAAVPDPAYPGIVALVLLRGNVQIAALARPDFVVPARYVSADGGHIDFAGIDAVAYPALPRDGTTAWYRDGAFAPAQLPWSRCRLVSGPSCPATVTPGTTRVIAVEYYNPALDHYFITASAAEIDALDTGAIAGWQRTGQQLAVGQAPRTSDSLEYVYRATPVCRFYLPPAAGDSHFFSASADECAAVSAHFPSLVKESDAAFHVATPDPSSGECGVIAGFVDGDIPLLPVYRLWNGRAAGNHRYTADATVREAMIARGWVPEGYGPLGVVMCV